MTPLLTLSRLIDKLTTGVGKFAMWLILLTTLISAANALARKFFNIGSNSLLEVQWYLFAAVFMLGAGYGFLRNSHVRIDVLASRFSARTRNWVDILGIVFVLIPFCAIGIGLGWPFFLQAYQSGEMSQNAGGLVRWPAYLLIPVGFGLLLMQSVSELIKRAAFILGRGPDVLSHEETKSDDEKHAEELQAQLAKELAGTK